MRSAIAMACSRGLPLRISFAMLVEMMSWLEPGFSGIASPDEEVLIGLGPGRARVRERESGSCRLRTDIRLC